MEKSSSSHVQRPSMASSTSSCPSDPPLYNKQRIRDWEVPLSPFLSHFTQSPYMANDWSALFDKMLSDRDLRVRRITTSWRQEYMQFASSIPVEIFNHPRPPFILNLNMSVLFKGAPHNDLLLVYSRKPGKAKFMLHLPGNVDFNTHRRIDAYYKWVGNLLEIKLQPALNPQALMDLNDNLIQFHLLAERLISPADIINKEIRHPRMDVRPFYNICTEELQQAINDVSSTSVQVFPPGEMVSYGADIRFEKGQGLAVSPLEFCKVVCLRVFVSEDAEPCCFQTKRLTVNGAEEGYHRSIYNFITI